MRRWRCVGRVGIETKDSRLVLDAHAPDHLVPVRLPHTNALGHHGLDVVATVKVRVRGDRIEARLPWRYRNVTPALLGGETEWGDEDDRLVITGATVRGFGPGPSAWRAEDLL